MTHPDPNKVPSRATSALAWAPALLAGAFALAAGAASAQSYTAKVLPYPATATGCDGSKAYLDDQGNVQGRCYFKQTDLGVIFFAWLSGGRANDLYKTVVWRPTGLPQILNGYGHGFNPSAQVIGAAPTDNAGRPQAVYSYWAGSTRKDVLSVPGLAGAWSIRFGSRSLSRGGRAMLLDELPGSGTSRLAVLRDGVATVVPAAPAACRPTPAGYVTNMFFAVNDAGQVGSLAASETTAHGSVDATVPVYHQPCLWDGTTWHVGPALPEVPNNVHYRQSYELQSRSLQKMDISSTGELLLHALKANAFTWRAGSGALTPVDGGARQYGANDQWLGGDLPSDIYREAPALVWQQGAPVDLNTVAAGLPSDLMMTSAVAANRKGQILAVAVPRSGSVLREKVRLVLLTPR